MEGGHHRRSKSASTVEGNLPVHKLKAYNKWSPDNSLHGNGSSSSGGMAWLKRLNYLWNIKQRKNLPEDHRQNNVSINIKPDRQSPGCLPYNRRKQQFNPVFDEPKASHFVNRRPSSEWSSSLMPIQSEMRITRQKIDAKHLSLGELISVKSMDSKGISTNFARNLVSMNANERSSSSISHPERRDGLLLESHNPYGAHASSRISNTQEVDKKKKEIFPRPIVFPRSDMRNIPTAWRTNGSYHDVRVSKQASDASRKLAMVESGNEMYRESQESLSSGLITREGNKRVLETLKITRMYQDHELDDDASTLREVIAIPSKETRYTNFPHRERSGARLGTDSQSTIFSGPSRSRSIPPIECRVLKRETSLDLMQNGLISRGRSWAVERFLVHNFLSSEGSNSRGKMPLPFPPIHIRETESSLEATFQIPTEPNVEDFSEQRLCERDANSGDTVYDIMIDKQEISTLPFELSAFHPRHSSQANESSDSDDQDDFNVQKAPMTLIMVAHSQTPHAEDASFISENFERFNVELNELRTILQLPKLDVAYPSSSAERWKDSYMIDALIQSSFQDFGFDMLPIMWHSPDYPLNPALFDALKTKYGEELPELKPVRLLLFDLINSALSEIFHKRIDLHPWLMPKLGLLSKRIKEPPVEKLISHKSSNMQIIETILVRDMQWIDPVEEFASTGNELEKLLLNELIAEFTYDLY